MPTGIDQLIGFALRFVILIPAIVFHEVAHGYAALALGDETAKIHRRLTLNPIRHIDPFGTLLMPALLLLLSGGSFAFGYAKPVPVNPQNFRDDVDRHWGMFLVAIAGPGTNLAMAAVTAIVVRALDLIGAASATASIPLQLLYSMTVSFVYLNLVLMVFNLVPIPPLDGSRVLPLVLPRSARPFLWQMERYGLPILFVVLFLMPMVLHFSPVSVFLQYTVAPLFQLLTGTSVG